MSLYQSHAVANGIRTDHPIPGLPFVDDSHIPIEDSSAIEAIGRRPGGETWGRDDRAWPRPNNGWVAYTTDPHRHDLAWVVRWHPKHGRSVVLYRDNDAIQAYGDYVDGALLFRSGGYWWDGETWYRPQQVFDRPNRDYCRRSTPGASAVTADGILATAGTNPDRGTVADINAVALDASYEGSWNDDLALWAERRNFQNLNQCVVSLTAPELAAEHLINATEFANVAGIGGSTLRAYITRDEGDVPLPQAVLGGRSLWARPVAAEWAEQRQRNPDAVDASVSIPGRYGTPVPAGQAELASALTRGFLANLWDWRPFRSRWALRWRTQSHVTEVADALGYEAASYVVRNFLPLGALSHTLHLALVEDLRDCQRAHSSLENILDDPPNRRLRVVSADDAADDKDSPAIYGFSLKIEEMLVWLARHSPSTAGYVINDVIGDAERDLGIPRHVTTYVFRSALTLDLQEYAEKVLPPETETNPATSG